MRHFQSFSDGAIRILDWGDFRSGISVVLALSIPPGGTGAKHAGNHYLYIIDIVVVFFISAQGMTLGKLTKQIYPDRLRNRQSLRLED